MLRLATEQVPEGELNGKPLEPSFSFAQEFNDQVAPNSAAGGFTYDSYVEVCDDSGLLTFDLSLVYTRSRIRTSLERQ